MNVKIIPMLTTITGSAVASIEIANPWITSCHGQSSNFVRSTSPADIRWRCNIR